MSVVNQTSGATQTYLANAQGAISRGFEGDIRYQPIDGLQTYASITYDDAYYSSFTNSPCPFQVSPTVQKNCNFTGWRLSLTPRWAAAAGAEYSQNLGQLLDFVQKPVVGYVGADATFQTSTYSDTTNLIYNVIPAYALVNLHAGVKFEDGSWDLSAGSTMWRTSITGSMSARPPAASSAATWAIRSMPA